MDKLSDYFREHKAFCDNPLDEVCCCVLVFNVNCVPCHEKNNETEKLRGMSIKNRFARIITLRSHILYAAVAIPLFMLYGTSSYVLRTQLEIA